MRTKLGRQFGWLWAAFAVSTAGTWLAFDAFPMIAILVLHADATAVAFLAATGLAAGAVVAVPLSVWVEFHRKRSVMVAMDLIRFAALISVPAAFLFGVLSFSQLLVVSIVVAAADVTFNAASGAYLKASVPQPHLLAANARFESTAWTASIAGPPIGGAAIAILGPASTVSMNAVSFILSAASLGAIRGTETPAPRSESTHRHRGRDLLDGWRIILAHRTFRLLFANTVVVNSLILAPAPLLAALMLGPLGFAPWQYALAFALPCLGGIVGSRLAQPLVARFGQHAVLRTSGALRACWSVGLAAVSSGVPGVALVIVVQFGLVTCAGIFNPVLATYRLEQLPATYAARALSAWSTTTKACVAVLTGLWGGLAEMTGPRIAVAVAGLLLLATPLLLPRQLHRNAPLTVDRLVCQSPSHREPVTPSQ